MKHWKPIKFFVYLSLCLIILYGYREFRGFDPSRIISVKNYLHSFPLEATPPSLNQSFYYFGSGVQSYVFIGEDKKTILKLFKQPHPFKNWILRKKWIKKREKKMRHLLQSALIARTILPEETGVFYTHLGHTQTEMGKVILYDKLRIPHKIALERADFILQKKGLTASEKLHQLFQKGDIEEAKNAMISLLSLIEYRSQKGVKKLDGKIGENCGFIENTPLEIDIGSYRMRTPSSNPHPHQKAKLKGALQLLHWVKIHYPQYLQQTKEALLNENIL